MVKNMTTKNKEQSSVSSLPLTERQVPSVPKMASNVLSLDEIYRVVFLNTNYL